MKTGELRRMPSMADGGSAILEWSRQMRDEQPLWVDEQGRHHIFRYADVQAALSDPARFSSNVSRVMPYFDPERVSANLPWQDPPDHRKLRLLVSQAFVPRTVADLRPRIVQIVRDLLAACPDGSFDFIEHLAHPLSVIVIAEMLGISPADRPFFRHCADRFLGISADPSRQRTQEELSKESADASKELDDYLIAQVAERRSGKITGDVLSALVEADVDGERLSDIQVSTFSSVLLNAGHLTTTLLLGNAMLCLTDNPGAAAEVRADRSLLPGTLEEVLRCRPPLHRVIRITNEDVPIAGGVIPANSFVMPLVLSANHDERKFPDPEQFNIRRDPNKHLGFGRGIHFCLGAPLARLEVQIALDLIFDTFENLTVTQGGVFHDSQFYGPKELAVTGRRQ